MNEDFVGNELARKLQEKGYPLRKVYRQNGAPFFYDLPQDHPDWDQCDAWYLPTIWEVLKWLREEKNLYCLPFFEQGIDLWFYAICKPACGSEFPEFISESDYDTYELAALAGIEYVIDNII